ncbi:hypothetical protein UA08_02001 [Talaromyces atroroseus]|uniref:SUI1 domain-containing protein n=1 Tax=Talaromyces atroroseus TaxID=1441469 RepID=A0A1Q5QAY6_TALAT|nr:hypothetical protein UA08_02001 [Talaromyces atroroseus]OKL63095.1 hypothetical protein UA08_02001 [Talaromyces atroroseus]
MASKKDMRRADLVIPYVEPPAEKSDADIGGTMSTTLPMAAMFTRNRLAVVVSLQNWLSETPEQSKNAATPGYMSIFMSPTMLCRLSMTSLCPVVNVKPRSRRGQPQFSHAADSARLANQRIGHRAESSTLGCFGLLDASPLAPALPLFSFKKNPLPSTHRLFLHLSALTHQLQPADASSTETYEFSLPAALSIPPFSNKFQQKAEFMSIENLKTFGKSTDDAPAAVLHRATPCYTACSTHWAERAVIACCRVGIMAAAVVFEERDPFAEADEDTGETKQSQNYIHIRIQQRNGRKTLTTVQGLPKKFDQKKILKVIKKKFACNGTIVNDTEMGEVIQLQGDQRKDVQEFLVDKKEGLELDAKTIKVHGF